MGDPRVDSDVEVVSVARRRVFSDAYKRRILDEIGRAGRGEVGLILRREGLYSSTVSNWRKRRDGMTTEGKGKEKQTFTALQREKNALEKENARLKLKLAKAEAMLELQKKAADLFRLHDESSETD